MNQRETAGLIGRSVGWLRQSDCPREENKTYNPVAVARWYIDRETAKIKELKERYDELQVQLLECRGEKLTIENQLASGEMMRVADFNEIAQEIASPLRRAGDLFSRGARFAGADAASVMQQACEDAKRVIKSKLLLITKE